MTKELGPEQKRNAARMIAALTCTKLGDVLINSKTVLTWLLTQMGVSPWVVSLLIPAIHAAPAADFRMGETL